MINEDVLSKISEKSFLIVNHIRESKPSDKYNLVRGVESLNGLLSDLKLPYLGEGLFRCGYDFEMLLFNEVETTPFEMKICFECNRLYINKNGYGINREYFQQVLGEYFKEYEKIALNFTDQLSGKEFVDNAILNKSVLSDIRLLPKWYNYDGSFKLFFEQQKDAVSGKFNREEELSKLINKLQTDFPGEMFDARCDGFFPLGSKIEFDFTVYCKESLFSKVTWNEKQDLWTPFYEFNGNVYQIN